VINRDNYHDVKQYLLYLSEVKQNSEKTTRKRWAQLRHFLEWAGEEPFPEAQRIRPTYPQYLLTARNDGREGRLSAEAIRGACGTSKRFLTWARMALPNHYRKLAASWIDSIVPPRLADGEPPKREVFDLAAVRSILSVEARTLTQRRDKAAVAGLFLSGMRAGAFVTLPISAVDLDQLVVKQWPSMGVQTKNSKAATTYLLDIPDLVDEARNWDRVVTGKLPSSALWYASLTTDGMRITGRSSVTVHRVTFLAKGIRRLCEAAGIPYLSPHKLGHGHAVYAIERARTVGDLKAVSQNLMHSSLVITDGIYGGLTADKTATRIASLTAGLADGQDGEGQSSILEQLKAIVAQLEG
jgi:integrase